MALKPLWLVRTLHRHCCILDPVVLLRCQYHEEVKNAVLHKSETVVEAEVGGVVENV